MMICESKPRDWIREKNISCRNSDVTSLSSR